MVADSRDQLCGSSRTVARQQHGTHYGAVCYHPFHAVTTCLTTFKRWTHSASPVGPVVYTQFWCFCKCNMPCHPAPLIAPGFSETLGLCWLLPEICDAFCWLRMCPAVNASPGDLVHLDGIMPPASYPKVLKLDEWKQVVPGLLVKGGKVSHGCARTAFSNYKPGSCAQCLSQSERVGEAGLTCNLSMRH
jgi:hypothetical protein